MICKSLSWMLVVVFSVQMCIARQCCIFDWSCSHLMGSWSPCIVKKQASFPLILCIIP